MKQSLTDFEHDMRVLFKDEAQKLIDYLKLKSWLGNIVELPREI